MLKKSLSILMIFIFIIGACSSVNATELKTSLNIVQQASETKYLENDQGFISKTIVDSNKDTGEVTVEVKLSNTKKDITKSNDTEIILVIDNSISMDFKTQEGKTRKSIILDSAKKLVNNVFNTSSNVKMGIVKFCGETSLWGPLYAASEVTEPTENKETVLKGLETIEKRKTESGTNIQEGLIKAQASFSKNAGNKVIILLTDGCPNEDAKRNSVTDSKMVMTNEEYKTILENTKNELLNIKQNGIKLISLMTGVNSNDLDEDGNIVTNTEDEIQSIKVIFGTEEKATAGKFYNVKTADVNKIISEDITKDVQEILNSPLNTVKIVDYFPEDITENFEFSYVGKANLGTSSEKIDTEKKTIEWNIGTLKGDEIATLRYKLKIKDMKNKNLLNKVIATNEKVVLTYKDINNKDYTVTLTSSPKIQLSEVKEELIATVTYDPKTETTGNVKATIKTNKKVNEVKGWALSEDGMSLTKSYSANTTETVHLVDIDGMTADVIVTVANIKKSNTNDASNNKPDSSKNTPTNGADNTTVAGGVLPQAGTSMTIVLMLAGFIVLVIVSYKKYRSYKDIK